MGVQNFIPQVWAARAEFHLRKTLVYGSLCNRDYEGDIRDLGDTVKINMIGAISNSTYTRNTTIGNPSPLNSAQSALVLDQARYYNFSIDDVDRVQSNVDYMDAAIEEAQYGLADTMDQYIVGLWADAVPVNNTIGSTGSPKADVEDAGKAYQYLTELGVKLSDAKVPRANRWVVVPPWFYGYLQKDDKFVGSGSANADSRLQNGQIGMAAGFTVYESHNVPNSSETAYKIIAGTSRACTLAEQVVKLEAYRPDSFFCDAVKGLHVYGAKVVRPQALAMLIANVT